MTRLPPPILVATDASDDAHAAMRVAASLARSSGSALHVVHVWQMPFAFGIPPQLALGPELEDEAGAAILSEERSFLETQGATVSGVHLRHGTPALAILAVADVVQPGLLVLGRRGLGPVRRLVMGSVSDGVVRQATVPVLVVHGEHWPPSRVVVGDDGSDEGREAAELAADVAGRTGAPLIVVHALDGLEGAAEDASALVVVARPRSVEAHQAHRHGVAEQVLHRAAGSVLVVPGSTAHPGPGASRSTSAASPSSAMASTR